MKTEDDLPKTINQLKGDEIVISGLSGLFPDAEDTQQLSEKLYSKVDMVTKCNEYTFIKHPESPKYLGKVKGMEKFDAPFFRVTQWQAVSLDPLARKCMEQAFAALFDAGTNPETLKDSKLGVFISSTQADVSTLRLYSAFKTNAFIISGCSKAMLANRISYWLDGKGPSYAFDSGCSGSMAALEMAYNSIKNGDIDCAIVGGCNLCIHPVLDINMKRAGLLCVDGKTKCFDKNGDGYVRSEAVNVLFLQKAKDAKRIYSEVYYVKGKYFGAPDGSFSLLRNPGDTEGFFEEFYSEIDISPNQVEYIEANGVGVAEADAIELNAIGHVFGKDKTINIGSVKSNMGNTEAASGACSITKLCLAYQKGKIPANLYFSDPQNHIPAVEEERVRVITEHEPFNRGFTAINNFCYTGSNFHALLKGHYKPKDENLHKATIPRLVLISGRQKDCVSKMLDILETNAIDPEELALLNNFYKHNVPGYTGRGYTVLGSDKNKKTLSLARGFEFYSGNSRPVWFLYSGMGSQWAGMGKQLLRISVFEDAIKRCSNVLLPIGLDIIKIITDTDTKSLNIISNFVAITAVQIGLTDVLKSLGIVPDNIIGHSLGELGSAYADESLTLEETILASYSRGIVSNETSFIKGKMAAVGLGYKEVSKLCPPEIDVACHNSPESATISGPADIVTEFLKNLTLQGIFAREVASSNIAYHSRYLAKAGPAMVANLKQFIKEPKIRSKKWVSSCFLPEDWHKPEAKYASAEYFTHNLLNSVLFEEAAALIPDDAIVIEIAPHGLLQAIMRRSHSKCLNLSLTRRDEKDGVQHMLETLGKLYQAGLNLDVASLYPKVEFPVSTETPMLSHFVGWEHSTNWDLESFVLDKPKLNTSKEFVFSIYDDNYEFIKGHIRNGLIVVPEAVMLVFVWQTLAEYKGKSYKNLSVVFEDVKFHREIIIGSKDVVRLDITIQNGSRKFEVLNVNNVVADGYIEADDKKNDKGDQIRLSENESHLNQNDVYTLLRMRGHSYEGEFQSIVSANVQRNKATIKWNENWMTFLDSIIQFNVLSRNHDGISIVRLINKLTINVDEHDAARSEAINKKLLCNAVISEDIGITRCGGVIFEDIVFDEFNKTEIDARVLNSRQFVAHAPSNEVDLHTALQINLQVLCENLSFGEVIKLKEVISDEKNIISTKFKEIAEKMALPKIEIETIEANVTDFINMNRQSDTNVLICQNLLQNNTLLEELISEVRENTYILTIENKFDDKINLMNKEFNSNFKLETVTIMRVASQNIILMKKVKLLDMNKFHILSTQAEDVFSMSYLNKNLKQDKNNLIVMEKTQLFEVLDIIHEVKKYDNICLFVTDMSSPKFTPTNNYYKMQIQKGLKVNILVNNQWGSYAYISSGATCIRANNISLIAKELSNVESLTWIEASVKINKQTVQVCFAGLSTKDSKKLLRVGEKTCFGMDFSGIDIRGNNVMGLVRQGAMSDKVEADYDLLWPVPKHWTLAEAATVPLPYIHAFYCLVLKSSLRKNSNVLVTGAAGALGQAVISVALSHGCIVLAAVSNPDKKRFLLRLFPQLDENNIGYNYDGAFREMVIARTKNNRCGVVINCGSGKIREAAMECLAADNYFLDVNDSDFNENEKFGMSYLKEAKSYVSVDVSSIFDEKYIQNKKALRFMLSEGIAKGFVRPLTSVAYAPTDISRAFKLLSNRNNRGRVLISIKDPVISKAHLEVIPRITLSPKKTYVVVCDGTELGVELIDRLVVKGARRFLVHCNSKLLNGYFHVKYASWIHLGVTIGFNSDDIEIEENCMNLLKTGNKIDYTIDGIFIVVNEMSKTPFNIEHDNVNSNLVVSNLDMASRKYSDLRYFAVIAATSPNAYNDYSLKKIEKNCLLRNKLGLPSLFLQQVIKDEKLYPNSLSALFNTMESSLKHKFVNVLSSDAVDKHVVKPVSNILTTTPNKKFDGGLGTFYQVIIEDEVAASEPIVHMQNKFCLGDKHELLIDPEETNIMMIPGLEGNSQIFTSIAERLKKPAIVLQLGPDLSDSISEMAKKLFHYVKLRFYIKSPFYIVGYSFGVNVALELASLMEKEGLVGVVCCLDSSPDAMRVHLDAYLGNLTDQQLQNAIIKHYYKLGTGKKPTELNEILEETIKWSDKITLFIKYIKDQVPYTHEYMSNLLHTAYDRIKMAKEYSPKLNLESQLVLLKGIPHQDAEQLSDDYNLSKYSNKPVQVFTIESDHAQAPFDSGVSNFINKIMVL